MAITLTDKELSILVLIAYKNIDIANMLNRSKIAIDQSIERMFRKLHAHSKTELIIKSVRLGLISIYGFKCPTDEFEGYA